MIADNEPWKTKLEDMNSKTIDGRKRADPDKLPNRKSWNADGKDWPIGIVITKQ